MPNYYYTLTKSRSKSREFNNSQTQSTRYIFSTSEINVKQAILRELLTNKRESRYYKLMQKYDGNVDDAKALREYLPMRYIPYVDNLDLLKEILASPHEIIQLYEISNIEPAPTCQGCLYDCMGQRDHMECNTGCLHDPIMCGNCTYH